MSKPSKQDIISKLTENNSLENDELNALKNYLKFSVFGLNIRDIIAIILTVIIIVSVAWAVIELFENIETQPETVTVAGAEVAFDVFQRAKDVFALLSPLLTLAFGYWLGERSGNEAAKKAEESQEKAVEDKKRAEERSHAIIEETNEQVGTALQSLNETIDAELTSQARVEEVYRVINKFKPQSDEINKQLELAGTKGQSIFDALNEALASH